MVVRAVEQDPGCGPPIAGMRARSAQREGHGGSTGGFRSGDEERCLDSAAQTQIRIGSACGDQLHRSHTGGEAAIASAMEAAARSSAQVGYARSKISDPRAKESMGVCLEEGHSSPLLAAVGIPIATVLNQEVGVLSLALPMASGQTTVPPVTWEVPGAPCKPTSTLSPARSRFGHKTLMTRRKGGKQLTAYHLHHNCVHGSKRVGAQNRGEDGGRPFEAYGDSDATAKEEH